MFVQSLTWDDAQRQKLKRADPSKISLDPFDFRRLWLWYSMVVIQARLSALVGELRASSVFCRVRMAVGAKLYVDIFERQLELYNQTTMADLAFQHV